MRRAMRHSALLEQCISRPCTQLLARTDASFFQRQSARNLTLAMMAALLRHRAVHKLRSPKLAAAVMFGATATVAATAAAAAAIATAIDIPFRLPRGGVLGHEEWRSVLAPLRPLVERYTTPVLHAYLLPWLVRPALRLNSAAIHRTAALLQGSLRVSFASDNNDGLVDLPSHIGVDAAEASRPTDHHHHHHGSRRTPGVDGNGELSSMRAVASAGELRDRSAGGNAEASRARCDDAPSSRSLEAARRNFSHSDVASAGVALPGTSRDDAQPLAKLEKGRWHILRVPEADHGLGTMASEKSDDMYRELFGLLDACT